jgi:DNA polymerase-3 subunit delta'
MLQLGRTDAVINRELGSKLDEAAARSSPAETLATLDAITIARHRIEANVAPVLALEAMLVSFRRP